MSNLRNSWKKGLNKNLIFNLTETDIKKFIKKNMLNYPYHPATNNGVMYVVRV